MNVCRFTTQLMVDGLTGDTGTLVLLHAVTAPKHGQGRAIILHPLMAERRVKAEIRIHTYAT